MARATADSTRAFASAKIAEGLSADAYGELDGLVASSLGLGTYLGKPDDETDILYTEAVIEAVRLGCNVIDSAVNYRFQRSERAIGTAMRRLVDADPAVRSRVLLCTKGGYVPFDTSAPTSRADMRRYVDETFFANGLCTPSDMASNFQHCMTPRYLEHQLGVSLENLGIDHVDVYYIHNPESQLADVARDVFERRLRDAFELLEASVASGAIGRYGLATWNGFRVEASSPAYLSLDRVVGLARDVGGPDHHFRVIQLPYNLAMPEAYASFNQVVGDEHVTTLEAARRLGISVIASASLHQSKLAGQLPPEVVEAFDLPTSALRAIQFVRSTEGVATALVGMSRTAHVRENASLLARERASGSVVRSLFEDA